MKRGDFAHKKLAATAGIASIPSLVIPKKPEDLILGHNSHQYKLDLNWGNLDPLPNLPDWHPGKGNAAWLFMNEIIIK